MRLSYRHIFSILLASIILAGCASKKRKNKEPSALGKFYHNTTAQYNGYFNANEIMKESYLNLEAAHQDNYTEILPLYGYINPDPKSEAGELDRAIEKVTTVALLHEPSHWVDDCYVLMGEAQYLKRDYETAEETFEYFKEEFDPGNPFGRNYKKKKVSKKALKKQKDKERKAKKKEKEKEKKAKQKEREEEKKKREAEKKQQKKDRDAKRKQREREKKQRQKDAKKKRKSGGKKKRTPKPKTTEDVKEETKVATPEPVKTEVKEEPEDAEQDDPRDEDEESEGVVKPADKKKKMDKTAYSEGLMWLAKTYVQRDKLSTAKYLVRRMQSEGTAPKSVTRELPVILADIYIKEDNYTDALIQLDAAIKAGNNREKKARYAFVAGQLSELINDKAAAADYYKKSKRWARDFQMEFMAGLNTIKTQMSSGGKSSKSVMAKLDNMAKQAKYIDFLDQIYYTKGDIALEDGDFNLALDNYRRSIANNSSNSALKAETYYKLANLFYDREDFVEAKYHYDSTLMALDKEDPRFGPVTRYAENLTDIAKNIEIIALQDSLIDLTRLSDEELRVIAEKQVEEGVDARKATGAPAREKTLITGRKRTSGRSDFWAYNEQVRNRQRQAFEEKWGVIDLQDNWRRSASVNSFAEGEEVEDKGPSEEELKQNEIEAMMTSIKKQLPYSASQKAESFGIISAALFELGTLYRDKINNYNKAVETHETLLSRFPNTDKKLETYYYLYLSNLDKPDQPRAEYYKNKLVSEFPGTDYAKSVSDPAFAAALAQEDKKLENYYRETYALFENGDYQNAYQKSKKAEDMFGPENPLRPKFSLLNAMSLGSIKGKDIYVKALKEVIKTYPNTPEKARAEEIMRFLQGDKDAFKEVNMDEVDDIFSVEDNLKHYVAIVMYEVIPEKMEKAKIAVSEYNKEKHKDLKLQLSDTSLDREKKTELILVRKFKNKDLAMEYYHDIVKAGGDFIAPSLGSYSIYAVTQRNYRKLVIEKSDVRYRVFFDKYYLGK